MVQLAPADEYFGPLKMSILGIRNEIKDLGLRYDVNHDIATQTLSTAVLTERAIRDWEHKYPLDGQLPRSIYFLQRLYTKVLTQESRDKARATATWLFADFSRSPQAKLLKKVIAVEHLPALPSPSPSPEPKSSDIFAPFPLNVSPAPQQPPSTKSAPAAPNQPAQSNSNSNSNS